MVKRIPVDNQRDKLIDLGAEALADALLELASEINVAAERVERLVATPEEKVKLVKSKLSGLKRGRRFIDWRESSEFARTLREVLANLEEGVQDPVTGLLLVADFYMTDDHVIGRCDDSGGSVGDVYRHDARELFEVYAFACPDKEKVADIIFRLNTKDDYGVRDSVVECAGRALGEMRVRALMERFRSCADAADRDSDRIHYLRLIASMARQIGDAALFEKTRFLMFENYSPADFIDIARVYLENGDADTAFERLSRIPAGEWFRASERDALLLEIYRHRGQDEERTELLYRLFRSQYSVASLDALVEAVGHERREALIDEAAMDIRNRVGFDISDLQFLMDCGRMDEAEAYILPRGEKIDGEQYIDLPPIAAVLGKNMRYASASLIYRALLLSILERAYTKAYPHAVRYLKKLDQMAADVDDWKVAGDHRIFVEKLRREHGRKSGFWSRYEG